MEFEKLQQIIADTLSIDPDEVTMESRFRDDFGADSLDLYSIIAAIEDELDIEIPVEEAEKIITVEDALDAIREAVN